MRARSRAALGFEPSVSDFVFSLLSRLSFFALGSKRHSSCLSGPGSTAASLGGSPSSSLSSSSSCCGRCGIGTSSCRDNLQKSVAPRRKGPCVPSLSRIVFFWAPPLGAIPTLVREYLLWQLGLIFFGMPARGPSRHFRQMAGSRVAALWYDPPLSGGRRPLTHSPTPRVPTPRLLGVTKEWR